MKTNASNNQLHYSNEYYALANDISVLDYAQKLGLDFKKEGSEYRCRDEGFRSLMINPLKNTFYWNKYNIGGGTVRFAMAYNDFSRNEAIEHILGNRALANRCNFVETNSIKEDKKPFVLPEKNGDYKRLFAYLNKTRGIDYDTIKQFVDLGKIYQEKQHGNIVFIATDENENPVGATVRGTVPDKQFRGDITGTIKKYPFSLCGTTNRLYVYEASIDLMSDLSLIKLKGFKPNPHHRIDLGGTYSAPLFYYLENHPEIDEIVFRVDNDEAGKNAVRTMGGELLAMSKKVHVLFPAEKDVNQDLLNAIKEQELSPEAPIENEL